LNIVKTTKIYESDVAISEVGGSFSDLSLWAFWKEAGTIKTKVVFKDKVFIGGRYIGSLADPEWSEMEILSNNTDDHYPAFFITGDDSGLLVWGRAGEIFTLPAAVLKDLLDGNFKYRYSAAVSPVVPLAKLGNFAWVAVTWKDSMDTTQKYLLFTRVNDETSWTVVEKRAKIPNADSSSILHLRLLMYSTASKKYSIPALNQVQLIYYSKRYAGNWEVDSTVTLDWKE
jgi:hypothetical protein